VHERLAHGGLTHSWAESILAKRTATIWCPRGEMQHMVELGTHLEKSVKLCNA
jgi:hypothetical protein